MKRKITGFENVMKNLNREIKNIEGRTMKGLIEASIIVRRSMDETSPRIPIDLGNLRASWFVTTSSGEEISEPNFKGKRVGEMASNHASVVSKNKSIAVSSKNPLLIMGFSANYAVFVHENVGANFAGNPEKGKKYSRRSGAGAKFFESAVKNNERKIFQIIRDNAKIK